MHYYPGPLAGLYFVRPFAVAGARSRPVLQGVVICPAHPQGFLCTTIKIDMLLNGIFPAITTPFYADGRIYLKKLEHNVDRYSRGPASGMVVLGSTGEVVMLNEEE